MKDGIHPKTNRTTVKCTCGNTFEVGSTLDNISVEICSNCHPFWTGADKIVDLEGRVDKFKRKVNVGEKERKKRIEAIKAKIQKDKERKEAPKSLKEMLKIMQG